MIYTGDREDRPEKISLKNSFFEGEYSCVEVEAKVIYDSVQGDIINQYVVFSKVFDEQRKLYEGDLRKAVEETLRICKDKDVLRKYLEQEESAMIMYTFADQEREFNRALKEESVRGEIRGVIKLYHEEQHLAPSEIIKKIMSRYGLKKEEAEKYVEETFNLELV